MRFRWFWVFVILTVLTGIPSVRGQDADAIIKVANTHYDNQSWYKAAGFYLKAIERAPNNILAIYRIAECYRQITNYHSAEYSYELALRAEERYPAARYYYAVSQKFNGKYEEALNNFQTFIENVEAGKYAARLKAENATKFTEQARIEREGCLLALKELSKPSQDNQFTILSEPVNSVSNDFAPDTYLNDSIIVISSTRSDSKGGNFDNKFGEHLSDLFRFEKRENGWANSSISDRFEKVVNTNLHDANGVFNSDNTSFYYSHCSEECKIYVAKLVDGKWTDFGPLNTNVNANRSNSRHPSLTTNNDTLFFTSDRTGGYGDLDIYYSIDAGQNSWGPAKNLGEHINTAFNETSPFYDSKENALFFSSAGHKGHGGLDIFLAEKIFDPTTELYNMGLPYNSSRDDAFFILGDHVGYLASNREDGFGGFDIYSFQIESDEEIIAEIINFKEVAGRNSLFSTDFDFDDPEVGKIEDIISHHVASRLHGIDLALTSEQLAFFNKLSEADRARIERIVNTRLKSINSTDIIAVRHEDEFFYQQLNSDFKYHVDKMVTLYMEDYELAPSVDIAEDDIDFYETLNSNSKEKVDRYIALKLDEYEDLDFNDPFYSSLDPEEQHIVDDISTTYLESKTDLNNLNLPAEDLNFLNGLSDTDRALAEMSIVNHVAAISSTPEYEMGDGEQIFYQNMTSDEKSSLDHIATAFIESTVDNLENHLSAQDLDLYNGLSPAQRGSFDKVLAKRIQNFVKSDKYTLDVLDERDLKRMTELQLSGNVDINSILNDHEISDDSPLKTLALEDQDRFVRLLSNASHLVMMNTSSKIKDAALSVEREKEVEQLIAENKPNIPGSLTSEQQPLYSGLSPDESELFDELLVQQLTHYVESSPEMLTPDYANNPQSLSRLEARLNNDFDIDRIATGNGRLHSIASAMSPERKALMAGALVSAGKFLVVNNKDRLVALTGMNANSSEFIAQMSNNPAIQNATIPSSPTGSPINQTGPNAAIAANSPSAVNNTASSNGTSNLQTPSPEAGVNLNPSGNAVSRQAITAGDRPVAQIVETSRADYTAELSGRQKNVFNDLTLAEKQFMDEAISKTLSSYVAEDSRIFDLIESNDPQYAEVVNAKLASDFSVNTLSASSSLNPPPSLTNRPPAFRSDFSEVMANISKSVIKNHSSEFKALAASDTPPITANVNSASSPSVASNTGNTSEASRIGNQATNQASFTPSSSLANKSFNALVSEKVNELGTSLKSSNRQVYEQLTPQQKELFDDILSQRLVRAYKMDPDIYSSLQSNDDAVLQNGLSKIAAHADLKQPKSTDRSDTRNSINRLDGLEKDMFSKLLASSISTIIANEGQQLEYLVERDGVPTATTGPSNLSVNARDSGPVNSNSSIPTKINLENRRKVSITEDDYNYYYNLDSDKRDMIDKVVALRIVNEFAVKGQHNLKEDKEYLKKLPVDERNSIKRLARFLDGDHINDIKVNIVQQDLNYYDNISNKKKDDINRLIVGDIFNFTDEHNIYGVRGEDQRILSTLNPREKELFHLLHNIRSQTHNVFGSRLDLDKTILESQNIIGEVKSFDNQEFNNLIINGTLFAIEGGKALAQFPVNLVDKNGNVVVSTLTDNKGNFSFKNVSAKSNYTIQSSDAQLNSRAKDKYFIKELSASGNDAKILSNKYDEFFLSDGEVTSSVQNSLKEISNLITANPNSAIYIKIIDEEYGPAMEINQELISSLNANGVPNTSIKYKRELPSQSDNSFEGLFKNKVELYVESDKRIASNNYYSFLVRRDTNVENLSKELKVPEEVILEENNLKSNVIARNSIIRVWRPLSDPSLDLLINVSDFNYLEYRVQNGESVISIADKLRLPEELIMEVNNLNSPTLTSGQVIQIYVRK